MINKLTLSVIVLVKNEERHLPRFFDKLNGLNYCEIIVIDSGSADMSLEISRRYGASVVQKEWLGNQALQFNWALDHLEIKGDWILRLDADEYLLGETVKEINGILEGDNNPYDAFLMKRRHYVRRQWIKQGMYPLKIVRLFKKGFARYDDSMLMDEHLKVKGHTGELKEDFVDESLLGRLEWLDKHVDYAKRESKMVLQEKALNKSRRIYYKFPMFLRPLLLFLYIVIIRRGFLNGTTGLKWYLFQVFFYRFVVDIYIMAYRWEGVKNE